MMNNKTVWKRRNNHDLITNNILEIGDGYRAKNSEMDAKGLPFARAGNINNGFHFENADILCEISVMKAGNKISRHNDIVFTSKGTVGRFAFVRARTPRFVYSPQLCFWRVLDTSFIDPRFLFYWMHGNEFINQMNQVKGLTDMADYVSLSDQRKMFITLPPLPIQHKIANILSAYDDLIENNQRRIAILEEMSRNLYSEWFVHFRFPGHELAAFRETELGRVPEGWSITRLEDVAGVNGLSIRRGQEPEEIIYIDISSVSPGRVDNMEPMLFTEAPGRARRYVRHGDTIWSMVRPNRRSYSLILNPQKNLVVSTGFAVLTASHVPYSYLYFSTTTDAFVSYLSNHARGAAYPAVGAEDFEKVEILLPPESMLKSFETFVVPLLEQQHNLLQRNDNLRRTRDLLLPRLVSGEIDVSELEVAGVEELAVG